MVSTDFNRGTKLTLKGFIIAALVLLLLIPTLFIKGIVNDRTNNRDRALMEVSNKWAGKQYVVGPVLVIPYMLYSGNEKEKPTKHFYHFLPENLNITSDIIPEKRTQGIYDIMVYQSDIKLTGNFMISDVKKINIPEGDILWNEVRICMIIKDFTKGLGSQPILKWNNKQTVMDGELFQSEYISEGLNSSVNISPEQEEYQFEIDFNLRGSSELFFAPTGKTTHAQISSEWQHPSFSGDYLPKDISEDNGFTAKWDILNLNRNIQSWKKLQHEVFYSENANNLLGVKLFQPTTVYSKTDKAIKYAILFIALTFALCFFIEVLQRQSVHPIQYVLVGLALCVFYTLLLSISEYIDFLYAYAIASLATIMMITLYTKSIFKKWGTSLIFAGVLTLLYGFILVLLQLQETSLLIGSIGLFAVLAIIMYFSRRIDWSGQAK